MEDIKISIIIPVYNVKEYLNRCIESVINQKYKNLEIVLVNDGSTDNSGEICEKCANIDNRIIVIHKRNGGLMSAWKAGFHKSTGKYIGFVDSDDWIDDNMYDVLIKNAIDHHADIVTCQLIREVDGSKSIPEIQRLPPGVYCRERIADEIIPGIINDGSYLGRNISPSRVTKLFRRELITDNILFCDDNISFGEDLVTTFSCICDARKIVIIPQFYPYHYRIHNQSIIGKFDENRIKKVELLNIQLQKIAKSKGLSLDNQIANDYISLALGCIEEQILFAPYSKVLVIDKIKAIYSSKMFSESILKGNTKSFSRKHRTYLSFLKKGKYSQFYIFRRAFYNIKTFLKDKL